MIQRSKEEVHRLISLVVTEAKTWEQTPFSITVVEKGTGTHCLGYISKSYEKYFGELEGAGEDALEWIRKPVPRSVLPEILERFRAWGFVEVKEGGLREGDVLILRGVYLEMVLVVDERHGIVAKRGVGVWQTVLEEGKLRRLVVVLRRADA